MDGNLWSDVRRFHRAIMQCGGKWRQVRLKVGHGMVGKHLDRFLEHNVDSLASIQSTLVSKIYIYL
jgi:hypothetical protein